MPTTVRSLTDTDGARQFPPGLRNIDANTQLTIMGARQRMLEEELARTAGERDV